MPLWNIWHPAGAYSDDDKARFSGEITALYTGVGLPAFYVVVLFHELDSGSCYVGGKADDATVRIAIEHIARHSADSDRRRYIADAIGTIVTPYTRDRGLYCEFHVDETSRELWRTDGLAPPPAGSAAERRWVDENRPVPY